MKKNSEIPGTNFKLGYKILSTPIVLLNALGLLGLRVVTVAGTSKVSSIATLSLASKVHKLFILKRIMG